MLTVTEPAAALARDTALAQRALTSHDVTRTILRGDLGLFE